MGLKRAPEGLSKRPKIDQKTIKNHTCFETPSWTPKWFQNGPKNIEMLKTQCIFTSQAKFCLSAGPFFATPIEDSRSHCQKPIMFSPSYARSYTKNKVSVAKKTSKNYFRKSYRKWFEKLFKTRPLITHYSLLITSRLIFVWYVLGIRLVLAW